jgi:hypothetical protein
MATSAATPQHAVLFSPEPFSGYQQRIQRVWAMPKSDATRIKPVSTLLVEEFGDKDVLDPFQMPTTYIDHNEYAMDILHAQPHSSQAAVLFRPPITFRQAERYIKSFGRTWDGRSSWWKVLKDEAARIIAPNGKCISIGWDSNGLGKNRGFLMERILIVAHGGHWRDTLVVVERKDENAPADNRDELV